jgi:hypothetical protein
MPTTPMDQLKAMSHSDIQRFANYIGSRLRTIAKVYHTRVFASPEQKIQLYNTWEQELVGNHHSSFFLATWHLLKHGNRPR